MTDQYPQSAQSAANHFPDRGDDGLPLTPLTADLYSSLQWFEADIERVFQRRWLFVCHRSELSKVGDYVTFEIGRDSIIITCNKQGRFAAFHNVCTHRGARLRPPGTGNTAVFVCPYHAWTFNLDGTLRGAPHMQGLDKKCYGARKAWCEEWNGFVFINLSPEAPTPLAQYLSSADFAGHDLEHVKVIAAREYPINANWKIVGENNNECYHCPVSHRDSLAKILSATGNHEAYQSSSPEPNGEHDFLIFSPDLREGSLLPGAQTQTKDGQLVTKRLLGKTQQPPRLLSWFPSFTLAAFPDFGFVNDWIPISPTKTLFRTRWFVHEDAVEGVDYTTQEVIEMADQVNREDQGLLEQQQIGVNSTAYVPGPYNIPLEDDARKYLRAYIELVKT